tara:strand:+ start:1284 stop:1868 length:585 start_codon:yes stop_codon:yes gene_type:complete
MSKRKIIIFFGVFFLLLILIFYNKFFNKREIVQTNSIEDEINSYSSNVIKDVKYISKDSKGNKYTIKALTGEIDYSNTSIIFLKNVTAVIELTDKNNIKIVSDFGKYNTDNFDTIFSKNVIVDYLENRITGEYMDFSINRGTMLISNNVIYTNVDNILNADVVEMNIKTKDTKISMYDENKKVNIKSMEYNGNN